MEITPTSFARGVPPEERNGFFGLEGELIERAESAAAGPSASIVAVVTYTLDEVVQKVVKGEQYPVVKTYSIEPLHDEDAIRAVVALRDAAMQQRTGVAQLELPEVED